MSHTAHTAHTHTTNRTDPGRRLTRFVRTSLKPVIFKLSRKLSVTYWPGRRRSISGMLIALLTQFVPGFAPGLVHAAPVGAQVIAGSVSISQASKLTTNITQSTQNAVINWQSFSIGAKEAVNIVQPGASSVLLNRVIGGDPSRIFGSLSANGQVFLVNSAGVYFAPGASVNVGGLVASSMNITDSNFLAGKYQFDAGVGAAAVTNKGQLVGRYVVLSAPQVSNAGSIEAPSGSIALAAGGRVNLVIAGDQLLSLSVDAATANAAVVNSGNLRADGGKVFLTARSSNAVLDTVINTSGIVRATSLVNRNGAIVIDGGTAGVVQVGGALVAAGSTGGTVKVRADKVSVLAGATIDVSGNASLTAEHDLLLNGSVTGNLTTHSAALSFGKTSVTGNLTATATGDILQSAATGLTVSGTTTLTAVARNISLTNVGNDFGGSVTVTGGATNLTAMHDLSLNGSVAGNLTTQSAALKLGSTSVTGNLTVTASAAVTQSASLRVDGISNIHAEGHSVTLDQSSNALVGAVTLASAQTTIVDQAALTAHLTTTGTATLTSAHGLTLDGSVAGDLTTNSAGLMLGATSVNGSLNATATGAVGQSAAVNVTGNSIISAPLQAVRLADPSNNFGSVLTVSGAATKIVNADTLLVHVNTSGATSVSTGINDLIIDGNVTGNLSTHSAALSFGDTSVTGTMSAAASGAVSQSGRVSVGGASTIAAAGQSVTLANPLNTFTGLLSVAGAATQIKNMGALTAHLATTDTTTLTSTAGLAVDGSVTGKLSTDSVALSFGPMAVNGNVNASARGTVGQSGALTVTGSSTITALSHSVMLDNAGNNFGGALSLVSAADASISSGTGLTLNGSVTGNLTTSSGALSLGATTVGGDWAAHAAGAISQTGIVTVTGTSTIAAAGYSVTLANPANVFGGLVSTASAATQIADVNGLTARLSTTGPTSLVSACCMNVDGSVAGDLSTQSAALNFGATAVTGNLMTTATGAVTQNGTLTVAGTSKIAAAGQAVTLNNSGNNLGGTLSVAGAATQIVDTAPLTAHLTTTGATSVTSAKGLTLDGSVAGNLTATAGGAVSQNGALLVTGGTGISATGNSVMLTDTGNDFGGALNITSAAAQVVDMKALTIGGSISGDLTLRAAALTFAPTMVGGNLLATARGAVGQTGTLQVAGSTGINAAGQSVLLGLAGNDFGGALSITGAASQIADKNALIAHLTTTGATSLTAVNGLTVDGSVGGDLTASAGGALSQSGALLVTGSTGISAAGQAVTLNNAGNDFGGAVTITGAATQIVDKYALTAHLLNTGATSLTAVNGLTVDGTIGGDLSTNSAALRFGATHITGNLNATATGAVSQTDALSVLSVRGSAGIAASGQTVTLANANNVFGGPLTVTSAAAKIVDLAALTVHVTTTGATSIRSGDVLLLDGSVAGNLSTSSKALTLGATSVDGKFNAKATGAVSQTGVLDVGGSTVIDATAQVVTLNNPGNDFGGALTIASAATQIVDTSALTAHLSTTGLTSLTSTNGMNVDGSVAGELSTQSAAVNFGATTVTGNLLTAASGAVTQSGILAVSGTSNIAAAGQSVTLNNSANILTGALTVAGAATQIVDTAALTAHLDTTGATSVTSAQGLTLDGSVKGNLTATANGALSQTGALLVTGSTDIAAAGQSVTLDNPGNDFGGALNLMSAAAKIVDMNALTIGGSVAGDLTLRAAALTFAPTTVGGKLAVTAGGALGQTGALLVTGSTDIAAAGQSVMLNNPGNDFGGALTVAGAATQIVDTNALMAHLDTTGATGLTAVNGLTVDGRAGGDLSTRSATLSFGPTTIGGNLTAAAGGAVSQSGALLVAGSTGITAAGHAVTLDNAGNDFGGAVTMASAAAQIADKNGLTLDGSIGGDLSTQSAALTFGTTLVTGNLTAAATGAVNQTGTLTVLGKANIAASGQAVTLMNATNVFGGPLSVTSAAAQIVDMGALTAHLITTGVTSISSGTTLLLDGSVAGDLSTLSNALTLGATTIGGQFNATATGAVSQSGALNVGGSTGIAAAGQAVTLSNPGNHFGGALSVAGAATRIADTAALTAHLSTTGATSLTAINGLTVDGSVAGNLNTSSAALSFGATTVAGNLAAAATGAVSQSGALLVAGSSGIAAAGQAVTLINPGNDFGGALTLAGAAVQIADTNALIAHVATTGPTSLTAANGLTLDGSTKGDVTTISAALSFGTTAIAGNLNATATGAVSQTGPLTVAGNTGIAAPGQAVILTNPGNDFVGGVTIAGAAVQLADQNGLTAHVAATGATSLTAVNGLMVDGSVGGDLSTHSTALSFGPTAIGGTMNVAATGSVSQTGPLTVAGTTGIAAAGQSVTLINPGNDFGGALSVTAAATQIADQNALIAHLATTGPSSLTAGNGLTVDGSIAGNLMTQSAALNVGPTTVAGDLAASASGAVTQSGALLVAGSTGIAAAGQAVTLTNAGNDFGGALSVAGAAAQIVDSKPLTAHVATTGTTSISAANGLTLDGSIKGDLNTHSSALNFGLTRVGGNLTAAAGGAVGQSGALLVAGSTGIAADGQNVMLNNAGNTFGGALGITSAAAQIVDMGALTIGGNVAGDLTIHSAALIFGNTAVAGNLAASATGAVGQTGALSVAGSTGIAAANQGVTLDHADNNFVGTVNASGAAVSLADNHILTLGKITATQAHLSAQTTLQMASGGMVDAKDITLALGLAGTPLGSLANPINVQALAKVTFGAATPAVTAYFTSVPSMSFKFNNPLAETAYDSGSPLIFVNNVIYNDQLILSVNGTLYGSISRVLQAIQKKADGYAEAIDRGLQSNLEEYAAYPHTGSLKLQAPMCAGVLRVKADMADAAQARACTALIMVR